MRKRSRFSTAYWQTRPKALTARSSQPSATHARANARRASHAKSANQLNSKPTTPKRVCPSPVEEEGKRALIKLCLNTVSAHYDVVQNSLPQHLLLDSVNVRVELEAEV